MVLSDKALERAQMNWIECPIHENGINTHERIQYRASLYQSPKENLYISVTIFVVYSVY